MWEGRVRKGVLREVSEGRLGRPPESPNDTPGRVTRTRGQGVSTGSCPSGLCGEILGFQGSPRGHPEISRRSRPSAHTFGEFAVVLTEGVRGRNSDRRCAWPEF